MRNTFFARRLLVVVALCTFLVFGLAGSGQQRITRFIAPEPIAETNLLMNGMANANFRGLNRILKNQPANQQAWAFARGQALLIAECGNLLMLRPPQNDGKSTWMERCDDLRKSATELAVTLSKRDYVGSRKAFVNLANNCNCCHQNFRVDVEVVPFVDAK